MKKNEVMKSVSRTFNKIGFQLQKKSPEILIVTGLVGMVVTTVMACKATVKASEVAETTKDALDDIHEAEERGTTNAGNPYTKKDAQQDLVQVYTHTAVSYAKLYAPAAIMGAASITCILTSHRIQKQRNVALATTLAATNKAFKDYRGRVIERFGEQVEKELRYNIKAQEITETVTDDKGKTKTVKKVADVPAVEGWDPSKFSPYARAFDETNPSWLGNTEQNRFYLKARQAQATDMLRARGHLFLNEVYDMLNIPRTKMGAVVGWLYDPKCPELGDTYVDFGMFEVSTPREGTDVYDTIFILDFNARGDITDEIADHQYM